MTDADCTPGREPRSVAASLSYTWLTVKDVISHTEAQARCVSHYQRLFTPKWIYHRVCDAWPVRCQAYGYLPSQSALLLLFRIYPFIIPLKVEGCVGQSSWSHTKTLYPRTFTHPSTNRARRWATSLTWSTMLPLRHTATYTSTADNIVYVRRNRT